MSHQFGDFRSIETAVTIKEGAEVASFRVTGQSTVYVFVLLFDIEYKLSGSVQGLEHALIAQQISNSVRQMIPVKCASLRDR